MSRTEFPPASPVFGGAPGGSAQPRGRSSRGFGYGPELLDEFSLTKLVHMESPPFPPGTAGGAG